MNLFLVVYQHRDRVFSVHFSKFDAFFVNYRKKCDFFIFFADFLFKIEEKIIKNEPVSGSQTSTSLQEIDAKNR